MRATRELTSTVFLVFMAWMAGCVAGCGESAAPTGGGTPSPSPTASSDDETLQLDGAHVEYPGGSVLMKIVADDGVGTTALLGDDDGETITVTGATLETGEGQIEATFDEAGRTLTLTTSSGAKFTFVRHDDGTFDYTLERGGVVEYDGTDVSLVDSDTLLAKRVQRVVDVDPGETLDCAESLASEIAKKRCKLLFNIEEVSDDAPLVVAFKYDDDFFEISLSTCVFLQQVKGYFEDWEEECKRVYGGRSCEDDWTIGIRGEMLGLLLGQSALSHLATQMLERAVDPTAEELCGLEAPAREIKCDDATALLFSNGGFEEVAEGEEAFLTAWEATAGEPVVHPTKIDDQPADMPPGLNAEGEFYLELPPGAAIAQTFATEPNNTYAITLPVAVWNGPRPMVRTNVTYAVYDDGEPVVLTTDQEVSIAQDPIITTQRRWGAICPTSTLEIVNLADQSIFLDNVNVYVSNRDGR